MDAASSSSPSQGSTASSPALAAHFVLSFNALGQMVVASNNISHGLPPF